MLVIKAREENSIQKKTEIEIKMAARIIVTIFRLLNCKVIPEAKVQSVVNRFGSEVLAGFSAGSRVESLCIVPMAAMGNAISSYTGHFPRLDFDPVFDPVCDPTCDPICDPFRHIHLFPYGGMNRRLA